MTPDQAALPLGCGHNAFLRDRAIPGVLSKLPGTQDVPRKEQTESPDFSPLPEEKDREETILQESWDRQEGTKT